MKKFESYKNWINEKFIEDSDPIHDMGIGIDIKRNFNDSDELHMWIFKHLPHILGTDKIPEDIIQDSSYFIKEKYERKIEAYCRKYIRYENSYDKRTFQPITLHSILLENNFNDINEKFEEDSDPIKDMGIGMKAHRNFNSRKEFYNFMLIAIPYILNRKRIPENILYDLDEINTHYFNLIDHYVEKYLSFKNISFSESKCKFYMYADGLAAFLYKNKNLDKNHAIFEKFTEDSDPISDMGIGMMHEIDKFLENYAGSYSLKPNFTDIKDKIKYCTMGGKTEYVDYLLSISPDSDVNEILIIAVARHKLDIVKLLIEKYKANMYCDMNFRKYAPISYAIDYKDDNIIKYFLQKGLDPNYDNGELLIKASAKGRTEIVKLFIEAGANVNVNDDESLFRAAYNGETQTMRVLLDNGAKVNNRLRSTVSWWLRVYKRIRVTNLLKKRGLI